MPILSFLISLTSIVKLVKIFMDIKDTCNFQKSSKYIYNTAITLDCIIRRLPTVQGMLYICSDFVICRFGYRLLVVAEYT